MDPQLLREVLLAVQQISASDIADMSLRRSKVVHGQVANLYPDSVSLLFVRLDACFASLGEQVLGADGLMPLIIQAMNENTDLLDHALFSKLSILLNYVKDPNNEYELVSLIVAGSAVRYEKLLHIDLMHLAEESDKVIELDKQQQRENEEQLKVQIDELTEKMALEGQCFSYMEALANIIVNDKIKKNPERYAQYLATLTEVPGSKCAEPMTIIEHLITHHLQQIEEDKDISKSVKFAINQYKVVSGLYRTLNNPDYNVDSNVKQFKMDWNTHKSLLEQKQPFSGATFLRVAGAILSFGLAFPVLWQKDERKLVNKVGSFFYHKPVLPAKLNNEKSADDEQNKPFGKNV